MADGARDDVSEERVLLGAAEADVRHDLVEGAEEGQLQREEPTSGSIHRWIEDGKTEFEA